MKYEIREANNFDIDDINLLLKPYSREGVILERSREDIEKNIDKFFVAKVNNNTVGVVTYYNYNNELLEIRSLAVKEEYYLKGIGAALVSTMVEALLKSFNNVKIFALTNHPQFFKKSGFIVVLKDTLPEKIWKDCQYCAHQLHCDETALIYKWE